MSETIKAKPRRVVEGFFLKYIKGTGIDVGYKGYVDSEPLDGAIGVDFGYPGYDGKILPFGNQSLDYVYSSHTLEHITEYKEAIQEWFRVLKVGGFLIVTVPHQFLYEKKKALPSFWNGDHRRFYTPASLMAEIEESLEPNTYRLRELKDCDAGHDYTITPDRHSNAEYQIELIIEKIEKPTWEFV